MVVPRLTRTYNAERWFSRWVWGLVSGLLAAALALLTGTVLVSLVVAVGNLELDTSSFLHIFHYLSMALGALYAARYIGRMGWFSGALVAAMYFILLTWWVEGSWSFLSSENVVWLKQLGIAALIGSFGGIIGVNLAP
jgi:putative membrane protein (TIGR04086 family)